MTHTGLVLHAAYADHRTGPGHPERPDRYGAVAAALREGGLLDEGDELEPEPVDIDRICAVHAPEYVAEVEAACGRGPTLLDGDTAVSELSFLAARLAAGGAVTAVDRLFEGSWRNAFVACRPPGHHAERARAMGFCLFNNVAVAAQHARDRHGAERVAIVDWDVHHGNGTQHSFESDPHVHYTSLHQWPLYPGTGAASERGLGDGEGATLNCPMPPGSGDAEWLRAFEDRVLPELDAFRPELVIVSAGFDAHALDPLAACALTEEAYRTMTRGLLQIANTHAAGRMLSCLEGGYSLEALAASSRAHVEELLRAPATPPGA